MSKAPYPAILSGLCLLGLIMACTTLSAPIQPAGTETPIPTTQPTETATLAPPPTETVIPFSPTPELAPVCEPGAANVPTPTSCQLPIAEQRTVFCTNKVPYNLIFMNEGASYQVLSDFFQCSDAGKKDGKQMVTCTGLMATSFELKVCDPACAIPTVQAAITQCPAGYNYNDQAGCCTQDPLPVGQNCVVLHLATKSCVVDCSEFRTKATCEKNGYACEWNASNKTCQLRR